MRRTAFEVVLLMCLGTGVALGTNSWRAGGGIRFSRDYFQSARLPTAAPVEQPPAAPSSKLEHPFQVITHGEVVKAFEDPRREQGLIVFVDARNDEQFETGHIPGAIQADHYRLDQFLDAVMERASAADQVIVYCNGGQCEDSIFMGTDLLEAGLEQDVLYLYEGGFKEWEARGGLISKGRHE